MSGVCIGCRFDADGVVLFEGTSSLVVPLCCCRRCLLGEEGLWSGETLPSLSLVVDEGGVGGSVNPRNIKQKILHKYCFGNYSSVGAFVAYTVM
jgi:hypothetical protein